MTETHDIRRLYFEEGQSISQISRQTGHDRKTIRMYLGREDWNRSLPKVPSETTFPKLETFKAVIDEWLVEDKKARRKQRHTAKRIYQRLLEKYPQGFDCSYRTVASYISKRKREIYHTPEGYLPLEHQPGEAQGDFGEAAFYENGRLFNGKYLDLSFPYSNQGYLQLFKGENQQCLFEGLISIFEYMGGVPPQIWFDNTRTIVSKVIKGGGRTLTPDFLRFSEHYHFVPVFCNVDAGHEKGNVENKVGYHRRNLLVPVPHLASLTNYNKELLKQCDQDAQRAHYRKEATITDLYAADKTSLLALPEVPLDVSQYLPVKTNPYGRFYLQSGLHEYSTSPQYANSRILVKITAGEVIPLDKNYQAIVRHNRLYGDSRQQSMQWLPYLKQLSRKPQALKYSGIYPMLPPSLQEYLGKCQPETKGKILRMLATLTEKNGFASALETVDQALKYAVMDSDSLLNLHHRLWDPVLELPPLPPAKQIPALRRITPNLTAYDSCLVKAGETKC